MRDAGVMQTAQGFQETIGRIDEGPAFFTGGFKKAVAWRGRDGFREEVGFGDQPLTAHFA